MTSSSGYHNNDHLRFLLDQRAQRADLHGRFPSQSDFTDSPSLYSHAPFSPDMDSDAQSVTLPYSLTAHLGPPPSVLRSPMSAVSDRERLNFPEASSLDLDDDSQYSLSYHSHEDDAETLDDGDHLDDDAESDEEENSVAAYGPKMRFHSRAPWETGEDEEETHPPAHSKQKHSDKKNESTKRPWGLVSRSSHDNRKSEESSRSQNKSKHSFEATPSGGNALLALAQASMSSTSLALSTSPQPSFRDKLNFPRLRTRTAPSAKANLRLEPIDTRPVTPSLPTPTILQSPTRYQTTSPTEVSFPPSRPSYSSPPSPKTPHPYANPDLVRNMTLHDNSSHSHLHEPHVFTNSKPLLSPAVNRSQSNLTLSDSTTTSSMAHSGSDSTVTLTPVTTMSSILTKSDMSSHSRSEAMQGKGISGPLSVTRGDLSNSSGQYHHVEPKLVAGTNMSSWPENTGSAMKLISLQEAQAQARERSRSATATGMVMNGSSGLTAHRPEEYDALPSPAVPSTGWSRMRSTSTGSSRAKSSLTSSSTADLHHPLPPLPSELSQSSDVSGNSVQPKVVVRKKSGFMRLFNGKERSPAPPVPQASSQPLPSPTFPLAAPRKSSVHRVPVPSITPSLLDSSHGGGSGSSSEEYTSGSSHREKEQQSNARRNVHGLSIVTQPGSSLKSQQKPASPSATESTQHGHGLTPTTGVSSLPSAAPKESSIPSSAPPTSMDFIGLSLRPVSGMFSANFTDHLAPGRHSNDRPSLEADTGTPTTSTTGISPLSPGFPAQFGNRSSDEKNPSIAIASPQEDQSSVIQALQEQIVNARRAWQRQIWELEGQVRDLKAEVDGLRSAEEAKEYCPTCGRGAVSNQQDVSLDDLKKAGVSVRAHGVVNRPRARTGVGSRFASGT
ncbi:hypothetical protein K474DRAFT_1704820 [Panus rudis PR-1116 ss-1]|nr:hypothetical protein K474DRAFT_1704820 [Panus rudis PR-1116 ss-1]